MKAKMMTIWILAVLLLTSCSKPQPATAITTADTTESAVTTESYYTDLGTYDFDGSTFTIAYYSGQIGPMWIYESNEENGDIINDAVYERDRIIEEQYNVNILWYDHTDQGIAKLFQTSILAGDDAYNLGIGHMFEGVNGLISIGGLYDFNLLPNVNYEKPWWSQNLPDTLAVDNILLLHVNDLVYAFSDCIYFNKDMLENFQSLPDPYALVYDGTWTWDKLSEMAKTVSSDLDGNGVFDENDRYGFSLSNNTYMDNNWVYSNGMTIAHIKDGEISLDSVFSERMVNTVNMMYNLVHGDNITYIRKEGSGSTEIGDIKLLLEGRALFHENNTTLLPELRASDVEFGILPLPKHNEEQDNYYSMATTQMMMLPITLTDPEFTGVILEALAMESHRIVRPAVYETSFSAKYLRDEQSYEMYNIIRDSGVYDFNWNFGGGNNFARIMANIVRNGTPDMLASYYAKNKDAVMTKLEDILALIREA